MPIFSQKNQTFRTSDLLLLVGLVGGVGSIFGAVLAQALHDDRPMRAQMSAENLNREIGMRQILLARQASAPASERNPASVDSTPQELTDGEIGHDPWGQPFHYSVRKLGKDDAKITVFVWSDGPNRTSETNPPTSQGLENSDMRKFVLGGDDIGHTEEFKNTP